MSENVGKSRAFFSGRIKALTFRQKVTIFTLFLYWPALFVLAHIPVPRLVRKADVSDKSLHFLAYLILVFFLWFAMFYEKKVNWRKAGVWVILCLVVAYSVIDELSQPYVGRSCDAMDLVANLAGALTGLILFSIFTFWSAALLVTGTVIFGLTNIARANLAELLPITYMVFHVFAYCLFTILWIQFLHVSRSVKTRRAGWLITALAVPLAFMLVVKFISAFWGGSFESPQMLISAGSIVFVAGVIYLFLLYRRKAGGEQNHPL